jgi:hypothetical protein
MDAPYVPFDFAFVAGNTPSIIFTVTDGAGDPVDVSDADIYFTCKSDPSDADPGLFQLSTATGEIVIDGSTFTVTIPADKTKDLTALAYPWDCKVELAGNVQTVSGGALTPWPAITRA